VTHLVTGDKVTILEQKTVNGVLWGRIKDGWIMMQYVVLDNTASGGTSTTLNGTITGNSLRIRSGAGTSYSIVGYLNTGDKVTILETKTINGMQWGRIAKGWISMDYVKVQ
jgi:N-acetylmuramoyl-L-alanine amidase